MIPDSEVDSDVTCPDSVLEQSDSDVPCSTVPVINSTNTQCHSAPETRWTLEQESQLLLSTFTTEEIKTIHSFHKCKNLHCSSLTDSENRHFSKKSGDKFMHQWLMSDELTFSESTGVNWLVYKEGEGMFCLLCRKHSTVNMQNKSSKYSKDPAVRYKRKAVEDHANSKQHAAAVEAELISRVSFFAEEVRKTEDKKEDVYYNSFLAMYWLMKEELPNKKFTSLLNVLEQLGVDDMKYFKHRSAGSIREMFLLLGNIVKSQLAKDISRSSCYGLLTDEVCDVANKEQLVTFIKYVHHDTGKANTVFLSASDLLQNSTTGSPDAITIKDALVSQIETAGIEKAKLASFGSDGVSVMTGKRNGVAARLRNEIKPLINVHCICHRLALACAGANDSIAYLKQVERILLQLWSFFDNSAKKSSAYAKSVIAINDISISKKNKKHLRKRLRKACRTRWLSTEHAIEGVFRDYEALLQTLRVFKENGDSTATGLLQQIGNFKFISTVYLLHKVLPILGHLSKTFQEGEICLAAIKPALDYTIDRLEDVKNKEHVVELKSDLQGRLHRCELSSAPFCEQQANNLTVKYIDALKENITNRFDGSIEVLTAFRVFDPMSVPDKKDPGFKEYGLSDIEVLADHFYQVHDSEEKNIMKEELTCEWAKFKYNLLELKKQIPTEVTKTKTLCKSKTPTEWILEFMMRMKSTYQHFCPSLLHLAEICLSMPVSNAWPERGASAIKRIKTRLRSTLKNDMLESLLHISINGPSTNDCHDLVKEATKQWLAKPRRKLPKQPHNVTPTPTTSTSEAAVQVDMPTTDIIAMWEDAVTLDAEVEQMQQELENTVASLKLPADMDNYSDYTDEDDSDDESDSEC